MKCVIVACKLPGKDRVVSRLFLSFSIHFVFCSLTILDGLYFSFINNIFPRNMVIFVAQSSQALNIYLYDLVVSSKLENTQFQSCKLQTCNPFLVVNYFCLRIISSLGLTTCRVLDASARSGPKLFCVPCISSGSIFFFVFSIKTPPSF